ncbi:hypothetical protein D9756_011137 [Leucocoprinus leucothites]|uniref:Sulfate transporter n=1 Tax=Leucocoprinus leucothites TaxID=201217 RepID=A0A8H5CQU2_9AGAR|nr:hypothetical protein D9756_011137 [Leucoagaricus leucothites]
MPQSPSASELPTASAASTSQVSFIARMRRRLSDLVTPDPRPRPSTATPSSMHSPFLTDFDDEEPHSDDIANTPQPSAAWDHDSPSSQRFSLQPNSVQEDQEIAADNEQFSARMMPVPHEFQVHRAGLLQTRSYNAPGPLSSGSSTSPCSGQNPPYPHSQNTIRLTTMQLSNLPFHPSPTFITSDRHQRTWEPILGVPASAPPSSRGPSRERITTSSSFPSGHSPRQQGTYAIRFYEKLPNYPSHSEPITSSLLPNDVESAARSSGERTINDLTPSVTSHPTSKPASGEALPSHMPFISPHSTNTTVSENSFTQPEDRLPPETKSATPQVNASAGPSGLTLLRPRVSPPASPVATPSFSTTSTSGSETPKARSRPNPFDDLSNSTPNPMGYKTHDHDPTRLQVSERTPLLSAHGQNGHNSPSPQTGFLRSIFSSRHRVNSERPVFHFGSDASRWRKVARQKIYQLPTYSKMAFAAIPAVLLGCLINILDGVSYGMIIFPSTGVFADLGPMGVSLFFVSTVVGQLVYTCGGSGFAGANGSMMIEVVPFFHMIANSIATEIGEEHPKEVIATTLVAFSLSSILTGLSFFLLGALKLGKIVGFFPRHILVGCIGGIGVFLIRTGLTVSMQMPEEEFTMSLETLRAMFLDFKALILWTIPLTLAILLRLVTHKFNHQLIFPLYFVLMAAIFYIVTGTAKFDLGQLREAGWLFNLGTGSQESWYKFYTYFDYHLIKFGPLWSTLPTQFALLFFNILHPPLNVPALAVSLNEDVDTNKELVGHGYSNLLSGLVGSVPNYLVYVNTLLFYRVGGNNRIAGFLLAIATCVLLFIGTGPIAYIPVMVVGALIYVLGIDLVKEALWDTRHRVSRTEYITIVSIMVVMTGWDFVIGVLFGIVVSCFFFVVQNSQVRSIRAIYTGDTAMSAVRRPSLQRAYIRDVAKQTTILRLQGFLFFGTITYVEETIRNLIEGPSWQKNPIEFLVVDLTLVAGVDMSASEAFVRIQRLLSAKGVTLVFCGFAADSAVGKSLESADVLGAEGVELFLTFNDAMEWTENAYLRSWFRDHKIETSPTPLPVPLRPDSALDLQRTADSFVRSPRRSYLHSVGNRTIGAEYTLRSEPGTTSEPLNTVTKAFSSYGDIDAQNFSGISKYFAKITVPASHVLWRQGDAPDGLYIIESGVLRATYIFANQTQHLEECMVPGTVAGELSALANSPRNATCVVEHHATLWRMSMQDLDRLRREEPRLSALFTQLVLKAASTDYDILLSAIASRQ